MSFTYDPAAPTAGGNYALLPPGDYELQITDTEERKTKNNDPMVNVTCEVINNPEYNGKNIFHNVSFLPKDKPGAGMASHFLKSIGQPFEGTLEINSDDWIGAKFRAKIGEREYTKKDGITKAKVNEIKTLKPMDEEALMF
jgi:hypothetical protein